MHLHHAHRTPPSTHKHLTERTQLTTPIARIQRPICNAAMKRPRPRPLAILRGHASALTSATFLPGCDDESRRHLVTADEDGALRLWDTYGEECVLTFRGTSKSSPVLSLLPSSNNACCVAAHYKNGTLSTIDLSHADTPSVSTWSAGVHDSFCRAVRLEHDLIAAAGADADVHLLDERARKAVCKIPVTKARDTGFVLSLAASGDHALAAGYEGGAVVSLDTRMRDEVARAQPGQGEAVLALAAHSHVVVAAGSFAHVAAVADGNYVVARAQLSVPGVGDIRWTPDRRVLVTAGWDGRARVWAGARKQGSLLRYVTSLAWHEGSVACVALSADSTLAATGGKDTTVALWDARF